MPEGTQTEDTPTSPRAIGWCHWHKGLGEGLRLIQVVEASSGPGARMFACGRCCTRFSLTPFADQP
ncbi:hypothetical protein [Streptomyces sp. NPDC093223]|uniref:hypothetical protein n=1 Tax=Streptomyces sp. NPDC093223 TaxID=3366033 RepID=UPI0037FAD06B